MGQLAVRTGRRIAGAYLAAGAVLVCLCVLVEPGIYRGIFQAKVSVYAGGLDWFLRLRAETPPRWHWGPPRNHRYETATLEIMGEQDQTVALDLRRGTWRRGSEAGRLDRESLTRLVAAEADRSSLPAGLDTQVGAVLDLLHALRDGKAEPPRHHGWSVDTPFQASVWHFTSGSNYGLVAACAWLGLWPLAFLIPAARAKRRRLSPMRIYLLALAVVFALNGLLLLTQRIFSPGAVAEGTESLIGLVNLPALVLLRERIDLSWFGIVLGPFGWATLISAGMLVNWPPNPGHRTSRAT